MKTLTRIPADLLTLLAALTLAAWDTLVIGKSVESQEEEV